MGQIPPLAPFGPSSTAEERRADLERIHRSGQLNSFAIMVLAVTAIVTSTTIIVRLVSNG